jgi:hypothetical protein
MKKKVRTLDFYGFDDGCITKEGSNFIKNANIRGGTISKNGEYRVVNRIGK